MLRAVEENIPEEVQLAVKTVEGLILTSGV